MFSKTATAKVTKVHGIGAGKTASKKISGFDYEPREDGRYLYVSARACTVDVPNFNYDLLPSYEVGSPKNAYKTFEGGYVFLNHDQTPSKARGAIIAAKYHDENPDDKWVECLLEFDEDRCPKLCSLLRSGEIDTFSMGCSCESTKCSICGNDAEYPFQYCEHIQQKGRMFGDKLAYEICEGIDFIELSTVFQPADPTAYTVAMADSSGEIESLHPYDHRNEELNRQGLPLYSSDMLDEDEFVFF